MFSATLPFPPCSYQVHQLEDGVGSTSGAVQVGQAGGSIAKRESPNQNWEKYLVKTIRK